MGLVLPGVASGWRGLVFTAAHGGAMLAARSVRPNWWQAAVGGGLLALTRGLWPMLAGICIGTVVGVMLLPHDDSGRATVWLGLALVIYAVLGLVKGHFEVSPSMETWLGLLMGAATGAITVATGIFVIPGTPYLHSLSFERDKLVQALGLSFTVSTVMLAAALAYTGHLPLAGPSIAALAAALVGMWLGQLTRGKIKEETFRVWFFVGLLLLGGHLALRGVL